jgi:hypothetical protein
VNNAKRHPKIKEGFIEPKVTIKLVLGEIVSPNVRERDLKSPDKGKSKK